MKAMFLGLVILAPLTDRECGHAFSGQQAYCHQFCKEHLKGKAEAVTKKRERFYIEDDGKRSYCYCEVRVQLPVKLEAEKNP
jgi:hypothetical protein